MAVLRFFHVTAIFLVLFILIISTESVHAKKHDFEINNSPSNNASVSAPQNQSDEYRNEESGHQQQQIENTFVSSTVPAATTVVAQPSAASLNLKTLTAPTATSNIIANRDNISRSLQYTLEFNATNISEMAISSDPDFKNSIFRPYENSYQIILQPTPGKQTVYMKFAAPGGRVSDVITFDVVYEPELASIKGVTTSTVEKINPTPIVVPEKVHVAAQPALCPEHTTENSHAGYIIRERGKVKKYLVFDDQGVMCPVESVVIGYTWGKYTIKSVPQLPAYRISSPLSYRPGSIIRPKNSTISYTTETNGRLRPLTADEQKKVKTSRKVTIFRENSNVVKLFQRSTKLARTEQDILSR